MRRFSSVAFALGLLVACRSDSNNPGTDGSNGGSDGSGSGGAVTIQMVQNDAMAPGTPVTLEGVVVTAIDTFGAKTGNIWVEEPEGGQFSGILVFNAPVSQIASLAVGDLVNISGAQKEEFALSSDTSGLTDTELGPPSGGMITVTKTGTGTVPAPEVVDALTIGQMPDAASRAAAWEPYEGVLITVNNVSALNSAKAFGSGNLDQVSFGITGTANVESELANFPGEMAGSGSGSANPGTVKRGECFSSMTGVLDYFFTYNLLPRQASDIGADGNSCPATEQAAADGTIGTCGDSVDNDGNGFADCADLGCEVGSAAWVDAANCNHAADGVCGCSSNLAPGAGVNKVDTAAKAGPVILNNVVVTAVSGTGFWVADSATAAQNGGVFVFTSSAPTVAVKDNITSVQGIAGPFNRSTMTGSKSLVEVSNPTTVAGSGKVGTLTPISNATATTLADLTAGGPFAGSLVKLTNLKVKVAANNFGQVVLVDNSNATITMDDEAFAFYGGSKATPNNPAVGTCFTSLTGVMDLDTFDPQVRTINPTAAADMTTGSGCTGN